MFSDLRVTMDHRSWACVVSCVALLAASGCKRIGSVSDGVELVPGAWPPRPSTTYELRFAEAVIPPEMVGKPADPSPLRIRPPLQGSFVWLSQRSGVFTPTEFTR